MYIYEQSEKRNHSDYYDIYHFQFVTALWIEYLPWTVNETDAVLLPATLIAVHTYSPLSFGTLSAISSVLVIIHSLGGLVIMQSPCVESVIVNLPIVPVRTVPLLIVHWISAWGLAVAVQLNVALSGDTTVRLSGGAVMTGATVV